MTTPPKQQTTAVMEDFRFALMNNSLANAGFTKENKSAALKKKKTVAEKYVVTDASDQSSPINQTFNSKAVASREIRKRNATVGSDKTQFYFIQPVTEK